MEDLLLRLDRSCDGNGVCAPLWSSVTSLAGVVGNPRPVPPVLGDGQVLVDGFLVDNMPAAAMRSLNRGTVIGVDVASDCHMEAYDAAIEEKSWWWFLLHGRGHAPTMARVLMSSSAAASRSQNDSARAAADMLIEPVLDGVTVLSFKALDKAVEAGYRAAQEAFKLHSFPS